MTAISLLSFLVLAAASLPASAASHADTQARVMRATTAKANLEDPLCQSYNSLCVDTSSHPAGGYVGHDEPSIEFKSGRAGSGNDMTYTMTLPRDPKKQPNATGSGGSTWNFQLRPTFWFGLTLCDTQSAPEFTHKCRPDSDANNLVGTNPKARDYIGKHPGNAFMELQFYGPGYVPQFEGFGCARTQYCAAMTIDSFVQNQNTGVANTSACNNFVLGGPEPINWAYITKSGKSQAPANPLFTGTLTNPNFAEPVRTGRAVPGGLDDPALARPAPDRRGPGRRSPLPRDDARIGSIFPEDFIAISWVLREYLLVALLQWPVMSVSICLVCQIYRRGSACRGTRSVTSSHGKGFGGGAARP